MDKAPEELRFAKDHGACGVLKKGNQEADKWPSDPYFFPLYEEAERLDMPICFHAGSGVPDFSPVSEFQKSVFLRSDMSRPERVRGDGQVRCHEAVHQAAVRLHRNGGLMGAVPDVFHATPQFAELRGLLGRQHYDLGPNPMREHRFYVTCQVDEDLPYIVQFTAEDNLIVGSDFTHADPATEPEFLVRLRDRASRGEITETPSTR